jgi:hypothetical protein
MENGTPNAPARKKRVWRVVRWFLVAAAGIELLYVVAANLLLLYGIDKAFESTNSVTADFASGWTIWPGHVHVTSVRLIIADHNVEAVLRLEHAYLNLRLRELPFHRFHATEVTGDGVTFRFRHRIYPEGAHLASSRALPPVPGFEDPPVYEAFAPEARIPDDQYHLWTMHLENVDVAVSELWVQQFRYLGDARVHGSFKLVPARRLWVEPGTLVLRSGVLTVGPYQALHSFTGRIDCTVHPFEVEDSVGLEVLRHISTHLVLNGAVGEAAAADVFLEPSGKSQVSETRSAIAVDVDMVHGVVQRPSHVALSGDRFAVTSGNVTAEARGHFELTATTDGQWGGGSVTFAAATVAVGRLGSTITPIYIENPRAVAFSTGLDLTDSWDVLRASANVGEVRVPDFTLLDSLAPPTAHPAMHFRSGSGTMTGHADYVPGALSGAIAGRVSKAAARWDDLDVAAGADFDVILGAADSERSTSRLTVDVRASDVKVTSGSGPPARWTASVPSASFDTLLDLSHERAKGAVRLDAKAIRAVVGTVNVKTDVSADFVVDGSNAGQAKGEIKGGIDVGKTELTSADRTVKDWWAKLKVEPTNVALGKDVGLDGRVSARFRDGLPALMVFAEQHDVPGWLPSILPLNELNATLDVKRRCGLMDVQIPKAEGGPLVARGRIEHSPGDTHGAVLVGLSSVKVVSAGVTLAPDGTHVSPLVGESWLGDRFAELDRDATGACGNPNLSPRAL